METEKTDGIVCSVVVPLYNEEEVIGESYKRLTAVMEGEGISYELIMVNDGSRDRTEELARAICTADKRVKLINFARNFGHQTAITAGMDAAGGQCVVVIDADLQDPPEVIPEMLAKWREGIDVVYGKRISREGETFFKKFTAKTFYRTLNKMTDVSGSITATCAASSAGWASRPHRWSLNVKSASPAPPNIRSKRC